MDGQTTPRGNRQKISVIGRDSPLHPYRCGLTCLASGPSTGKGKDCTGAAGATWLLSRNTRPVDSLTWVRQTAPDLFVAIVIVWGRSLADNRPMLLLAPPAPSSVDWASRSPSHRRSVAVVGGPLLACSRVRCRCTGGELPPWRSCLSSPRGVAGSSGRHAAQMDS